MAKTKTATKSTRPAKAKTANVAKAKPESKHPTTSVMVMEAIETMREKSGSSLSAIKKYLIDNYNVDMDRMGSHVKRFLKTAVASGELVQPSGTGASGSFKLPTQGKPAGSKSRSSGQAADSAPPAAKVKKAKKPAVAPKKRSKRSEESSPSPNTTESAASKTPPAKPEKPLVTPATPKKNDPSASEESAAEESENKKPSAKAKAPAKKTAAAKAKGGRGRKPAAKKSA